MIPQAETASFPVTVATGHAGRQSFGQYAHALVASSRPASIGNRCVIGRSSIVTQTDARCDRVATEALNRRGVNRSGGRW